MSPAERIHDCKMNSQSIQSMHVNIYKEFFQNCEFVASAPGVFFWEGEHSVLAGGLSVIQHIPLRVYVGLEPTNLSRGGIDLITGFQKVFLPRSYAFDSFEDPELQKIRESVSDIVTGVFPKLNIQRCNFRIHMLSELMPGRGCDWSGAWSTAFMIVVLLYNEIITAEEVGNWKNKAIKELLNDKIFQLCYRYSWKIENAFHDNRASGYGVFGSMISTGQPMLYWTQKRGSTGYPPINVRERDEVIDNIEVAGTSFTESFQMSENADWPFLYGLINSGISKRTGHQIKKSEQLSTRLEKAFKSALDLSDSKIIASKVKDRDNFWVEVAADSLSNPRVNYNKALVSSGLLVLSALRTILFEGKEDEDNCLCHLAHSIRSVEACLRILNQGWYLSDSIDSIFYEFAYKNDIYDKVGLKLTGAGGGGMKLFVCPSLDQQELLNMLNPFFTENVGLTFDWIYSIDGLEHEGARVEKPVTSLFKFDGRIQCVESKQTEVREFLQSTNELKFTYLKLWETDLKYLKHTADIFLDVFYSTERSWKILCRGTEIELKELKKVGFNLIYYLLNKEYSSENFQVLSDEGIIGNYKLADLRSKILNPITDAVRSITGSPQFILGNTRNDSPKIYLKLGDLKLCAPETSFGTIRPGSTSN